MSAIVKDFGLQPCPFCGGAVRMHVSDLGSAGVCSFGKTYWIQGVGEGCICSGIVGGHKSASKLARQWNRRAS